MLRAALCLLLVVGFALLVAPVARAGSRESGRETASPASGPPWLAPVEGSVLRGFALGRHTYAAGWHRGVDLAAARGSPVRSACPGRVSFAGRVPRGALTVSVRCGAVVASYQQLGSVAVRAGAVLARGARLGAVGASSDPREPRSHLHLGAREVATGRYLDPLDLLRGAGPATPLLPPAGTRPRAAPLGPAPAGPRAAPARAPRAAPARPLRAAPRIAPARPLGVALRPAPARPLPVMPVPTPIRPRPGTAPLAPVDPTAAPPGGFEPGIPWSVWIGLACAGLGLRIGRFVRMRRRERAARRVERTA